MRVIAAARLMGAALAIVGVAGLIWGVAFAALGGDSSSIDSDIAATGGTTATAQYHESIPASCTVRSFVTARGVSVREFLNPSGQIFGVAWTGPRKPDLIVLLGDHYAEYQAAATKAAAHGPRTLHHLSVTSDDSVVTMMGHMGYSSGRAYAPSLVPDGVDVKAVVK